mgnify:CR=1 FL=1
MGEAWGEREAKGVDVDRESDRAGEAETVTEEHEHDGHRTSSGAVYRVWAGHTLPRRSVAVDRVQRSMIMDIYEILGWVVLVLLWAGGLFMLGAAWQTWVSGGVVIDHEHIDED